MRSDLKQEKDLSFLPGHLNGHVPIHLPACAYMAGPFWLHVQGIEHDTPLSAVFNGSKFVSGYTST